MAKEVTVETTAKKLATFPTAVPDDGLEVRPRPSPNRPRPATHVVPLAARTLATVAAKAGHTLVRLLALPFLAPRVGQGPVAGTPRPVDLPNDDAGQAVVRHAARLVAEEAGLPAAATVVVTYAVTLDAVVDVVPRRLAATNVGPAIVPETARLLPATAIGPCVPARPAPATKVEATVPAKKTDREVLGRPFGRVDDAHVPSAVAEVAAVVPVDRPVDVRLNPRHVVAKVDARMGRPKVLAVAATPAQAPVLPTEDSLAVDPNVTALPRPAAVGPIRRVDVAAPTAPLSPRHVAKALEDHALVAKKTTAVSPMRPEGHDHTVEALAVVALPTVLPEAVGEVLPIPEVVGGLVVTFADATSTVLVTTDHEEVVRKAPHLLAATKARLANASSVAADLAATLAKAATDPIPHVRPFADS